MAVVGNAEKMWSRTSGSIKAIPGWRREVRIVEAYTVVCDDPEDSLEVVLSAPNLPKICESWPDAEYIKVVTRTPQRISPIYWVVGIEYAGEADEQGYASSPINAPPELIWTDTESDEPIDEDANGNSIATVNGEPIEGVTTKIADTVLQIKRNYINFNPALQHAYRHSVNSDLFAGFAPGVAKLTKFSARRAWNNGCGDYWEVDAEVTFRYPWKTVPARAWWARVRSEGFYVQTGAAVYLTGGGGYGATAVPIIVGGRITSIVITNPGQGYLTSPTVTIVGGNSGGSGATAVAGVTAGQVINITVTNPGSGYRRIIERAVDDNDEPVTRPVYIDPQTGEQSLVPSWIEFQRYPALPYANLGLLDNSTEAPV